MKTHFVHTRVNPKILGICPLNFFTVTAVSTVSFKVVPLGTVGNCAQEDYSERAGGN
jgi:hypothetical protein